MGSDYFRFRDLPGPAWQHAGSAARAPSSTHGGGEERYRRFLEQLEDLKFLSDTTRAVATTIYDWPGIEVFCPSGEVEQIPMSIVATCSQDAVRLALDELERCRAIQVTEITGDTARIIVKAIFTCPWVWTRPRLECGHS